MTSLSLKVSHWLAKHTLQKKMPLNGHQGVVSITFDDVAASTCDIAAKLLNQYQVKGTFYVAGGLTDQLEEGILCHSKTQLIDLLGQGHELGCHSFSHTHYDRLSPSQIQMEITKDKAFLADCGVDPNTLNFAYPFGAYSYAAKQLCQQHFVSSRITGGGTMTAQADLQLLPSYRLYQQYDTSDLNEQIHIAAQQHGWLILNTHDISDTPSPYGYTTSELDKTINAILSSGCQIMSVKEAITYWQSVA